MRTIVILLVVMASVAYGSQEPQDPNFCRGCRSMMSFVTKFNSTEQRSEMKNVFKTFCEFYYTEADLENPCALFVEFLFDSMDLIDPINHCDYIGACEPDELSKASSGQQYHSRAGPFCRSCITLIDNVKAYATDPQNEQKIFELAESLCDYMKVLGLEQACKQDFSRNIKDAINFIRRIDSERVCASVRFCGPSPQKNAKKLPFLTDFNNFGLETSVVVGPGKESPLARPSPSCTICKTLVKEVSEIIKDNRTEQGIRQGLLKVCKLIFPRGPQRDKCDDMVDAYQKELIDLITEEADPEMVCVMLNECRPRDSLSERKSLDAVVDFGQFLSSLDPGLESRSLRSCIECKLFVKYLKSSFQDPEPQAYLKKWLLDHLCANIPDQKDAAACGTMVDKYMEKFFESVADEMDPQITCEEVGACRQRHFSSLLTIDNAQSSIRRKPIAVPERSPVKMPPPNETRVCDQCVKIIANIDDYLAQHPIDQEVDQIVQKVCGKIPEDNVKRLCSSLVEELGQNLINAIGQMESPRKLCTQMKLCAPAYLLK